MGSEKVQKFVKFYNFQPKTMVGYQNWYHKITILQTPLLTSEKRFAAKSKRGNKFNFHTNSFLYFLVK
jgi:hypothetical protein